MMALRPEHPSLHPSLHPLFFQNAVRRYRRLHHRLSRKHNGFLLFTKRQDTPPRPLNQQVAGSSLARRTA